MPITNYSDAKANRYNKKSCWYNKRDALRLERDSQHIQIGNVQGKLLEKEAIIKNDQTTIQKQRTTIQDLQTKGAGSSEEKMPMMVLSKVADDDPTKALYFLQTGKKMDAAASSRKDTMEFVNSSTQRTTDFGLATIAAMKENGGNGDGQATNLFSIGTTIFDGVIGANQSINDSFVNDTSINTDGGEDRLGRIEPGKSYKHDTNHYFALSFIINDSCCIMIITDRFLTC